MYVGIYIKYINIYIYQNTSTKVQYNSRCKEPAEDWSSFHQVPLASDT